VPCEVGFLYMQIPAQRFQILNEIIEGVRRFP
jgi:hypothetical protein